MEATMNGTRSHEPAGFGGASVVQGRLLWSTRRPLLLLVATLSLLVLLGAPFLDLEAARLLLVWPVLIGLVGPVWAFAVFHEEGPAQRHYHWSQPVQRHVHSLARIAAGAGWLVGTIGLLIVVALVLAAIDGNLGELRALGALAWLNMFTGPLIGYLGISVLTISSDYPLRWLLVLWLAALLLAILGDWLGTDHVLRWIAQVFAHPEWGLGATVSRPLEVGTARATASGSSAASWTLSSGQWLAASALWLGSFGALISLLALRHPDSGPRLPRLR